MRFFQVLFGSIWNFNNCALPFRRTSCRITDVTIQVVLAKKAQYTVERLEKHL